MYSLISYFHYSIFFFSFNVVCPTFFSSSVHCVFIFLVCPHGRYFLVVRAVSRFVIGTFEASMPNRNQICQPGKVSTCSDVQFGGPSILQLNIEGLTAGKMNVLHHLATRFEALVILLQETHCTSAEKLVQPNC